MKTRNAYALRDFDAARILQRRFFKEFHFAADKSDAEILQSMSATDFDSFETTQQKFDAMDVLIVKVVEYQKRIKRHGNRLTKYARAVEFRIATDVNINISDLRARHKRASDLSMKYCGCFSADGVTTHFLGGICVNDVGGLFQEIANRYKELEEKIKTHYRKIFATRLKQTRKEMRLTQTEFGTKLGLSQRGISNFENAVYEPSLAVLVKISKKLKRPVGWFLGVN